MEKSANKRWKESGSTLSFKEWINRENQKTETQSSGTFIPFEGASFDAIKPDTSIIQETLNEAKQNILSTSGFKTQESKSNVLGLDKGVLIFSGVLILGSLGLYLYMKKKKNG